MTVQRMSDHLWQYLATQPNQSAALYDWKQALGQWTEFSAFKKRYLQPMQYHVSSINCPTPCGLGCPRKVVDHSPDDIVAVCKENESPKFQLKKTDTLIYRLKNSIFQKEICTVLNFQCNISQLAGTHKTWVLGNYCPVAGKSFPVFLSLSNGQDDLEETIKTICLQSSAPFILLVLTKQLISHDTEQLINQKKSLCLALNEELEFSDTNGFQNTRPVEDTFRPLYNPPQKKEKEKDITPFPTPNGAIWRNVRITFLDGHKVRINVLDESCVANFTQMGMVNRSNGEPTEQWKLLQNMADTQGDIDWNHPSAKEQLKKQKQELSKCLRAYFPRIVGDPIKWNKKDKAYQCQFFLFPEPTDDSIITEFQLESI